LNISFSRLKQTLEENPNRLETTIFPEDLPSWFQLFIKSALLGVRTDSSKFLKKVTSSLHFLKHFERDFLRSFL
jgi:hypothetical protein